MLRTVNESVAGCDGLPPFHAERNTELALRPIALCPPVTVTLTAIVRGELLAAGSATVMVALWTPAARPEVLKDTVILSDSPVLVPLAGLTDSQLALSVML